jgi:AraC-like DNA-binding protein
MRAEDVHELLPQRGGGFSFTNLSIHPALFEKWRDGFWADLDVLYDPEVALPKMRRLEGRELDEVTEEARVLAGAPHSPLHLARFCFSIWSRFSEGDGQMPEGDELPDWLRDALVRIQEPECFQGGVRVFVALCGRSHEHVARSCQRLLGKSPREIVAEARLERAAHELRATSRSINEIALECGFAEPSPFFRQFRKRFGVTPRRYRWPE